MDFYGWIFMDFLNGAVFAALLDVSPFLCILPKLFNYIKERKRKCESTSKKQTQA